MHCVHIGVCVNSRGHRWEASSIAFHLIFLRQGLLHWTWTSPFQLHWLTVELWGSAYLYSQCWGYRWVPNMQLLHVCWRSELRSSCFHDTLPPEPFPALLVFFCFCLFSFSFKGTGMLWSGKFGWLHEIDLFVISIVCLFVHLLRSHSLVHNGLKFRIQFVSPPPSASWAPRFQAWWHIWVCSFFFFSFPKTGIVCEALECVLELFL